MSTPPISPRLPESVHPRGVRLLHTSDVHLGSDRDGGHRGGSPQAASVAGLQNLIALSRRHAADLLLIAGDFFDHNRIDFELTNAVAALFEDAAIPIVILPGNHDPYMANSVYARHRFPENVRILRDRAGELIVLPELGVQVWGQAHTDYFDFAPLGVSPAWLDQSDKPLWRIAVAHGLYVRSDYETRLSYRIHDHELEALQAHYVGLGHLERHEQIGRCAYYAGAPGLSNGATVVDLTPNGVVVRHAKFETKCASGAAIHS